MLRYSVQIRRLKIELNFAQMMKTRNAQADLIYYYLFLMKKLDFFNTM